MERLTNATLHRPLLIAISCILLGLIAGAFAEALVTVNNGSWLGRFGSVTVALGVLTFGALTSDLVIRGQVGWINDKSGDRSFPYSRRNLHYVFTVQTIVIIFGTLQWGFGDVIYGEACAC